MLSPSALIPGWHPDGVGPAQAGYIVVAAWHVAQFAARDPDTRRRPKLKEQRDIVVRRYINEHRIDRAEIYWSDGSEIGPFERNKFSLKLLRRIKWAIAETRRIAGAH